MKKILYLAQVESQTVSELQKDYQVNFIKLVDGLSFEELIPYLDIEIIIISTASKLTNILAWHAKNVGIKVIYEIQNKEEIQNDKIYIAGELIAITSNIITYDIKLKQFIQERFSQETNLIQHAKDLINLIESNINERKIDFSYKTPPIIVIGMHRSGTSMLVKLLEELGVFMGFQKESNNEAIYFLQKNEFLLSLADSTWDMPENFMNFVNTNEDQLVEFLKKSLIKNLGSLSYIGLENYKNYNCISNLPFLWGWKDPRNSLTLALWLKLFPDSKIIHIKRNGIDVAVSLKARLDKLFVGKEDLIKLKSSAIIMDNLMISSIKTKELEGGFSLWMYYLNAIKEITSSLPEKQFFEIKYEDLLAEPNQICGRLAAFIGVDVSQEKLIELSSLFNKDNSYKFQNNISLREFAETKHKELNIFGY